MSSRHVVVDGSNIATEGRSMPSLAQLDQAVTEFMGENPDDVVTVVVDASFGHRIDPSEVDMFEEAETAGELVSPPAGAIGRGDAFLLRIADKMGATVLSNDSFQEFHGEHVWLFDKGRLIGGKPVPGVGWIFTPRTPVRGPKSREAVKEAKRTKRDEPEAPASAIPGLDMAAERARGKGKGKKTVERAIAVATEEAVEPKASKRRRRRSKGGVPPAEPVNEPLTFITFIAAHPLGTEVDGTVDSFASHGAFVEVEGARCYLPLSAMGNPPPRSGREVFARGDARKFVIQALDPQRRGIELALPGFVRVAGTPTQETVDAEIAGEVPEPVSSGDGRRRGRKAAPAAMAPDVVPTPAPAKRSRKAAAAAAGPEVVPIAAPAKRSRKAAAAAAGPEAVPIPAPAKRSRKAAAAAAGPEAVPIPAPAKRSRKAEAAAPTALAEPRPRRGRKRAAGSAAPDGRPEHRAEMASTEPAAKKIASRKAVKAATADPVAGSGPPHPEAPADGGRKTAGGRATAAKARATPGPPSPTKDVGRGRQAAPVKGAQGSPSGATSARQPAAKPAPGKPPTPPAAPAKAASPTRSRAARSKATPSRAPASPNSTKAPRPVQAAGGTLPQGGRRDAPAPEPAQAAPATELATAADQVARRPPASTTSATGSSRNRTAANRAAAGKVAPNKVAAMRTEAALPSNAVAPVSDALASASTADGGLSKVSAEEKPAAPPAKVAKVARVARRASPPARRSP
jgi:Zc3h12a-like Ribonuclease NYN domain/S1 RNA binding domain